MKTNIKLAIIFILVMLGMATVVTTHSFVDEYENLLAGWLIVGGEIPYKDFFFHHAPLPFFITALAEWLAPQNGLVVARWLIFAFHAGTWTYLLKKLHPQLKWAAAISMFFLSFWLVPNFNLQMALADTLITLGLCLWLFLIIDWTLYAHTKFAEVVKVGLFTTLVAINSSVASLIPMMVIWITVLVNAIYRKNVKETISQILIIRKSIIYAVLTQLVWVIYFGTHQALGETWWAIFTYNQKYYFPNRLADGNLEQRFGMIFRIFHQFWLFFSHNLQLLITASMTFLQSLVNFPKTVMTGKSLEYLAIIFNQYFSILTQERVVWVIGLIIILSFAISRGVKILMAALFLAISLWYRSNEPFHLSSFVAMIVIGLSVMLFHQSSKQKKLTIFNVGGGLGLALLVITYFSGLSTTISQRPPLIDPQLEQTAQVANAYAHDGDTALVVGYQNLVYYLTQLKQSSVFGYYYPWFVPAEKIHLAYQHQLATAQPSMVIIETAGQSDYRADLFKLVTKNYTQIGDSEVWLRKQSEI